MSGWWHGLQPAEVEVDCGGQHHRLRWQAGALHVLDHDDLEGERSLAALGGDRCACVDVFDAWERHVADERVLVAASRGPADRVTRRPWQEPVDDADAGFGSSYFTFHPVGTSSFPLDPGLPDRDLIALLSLPGALPDRLVATVAAGCAGKALSPRMHAALYGRVAASLAVWLGRPDLELSLEVGERPSLTRDGGLHAVLPFAWLTDVWARGLAIVADRFCLAADDQDGRAVSCSRSRPISGRRDAAATALVPRPCARAGAARRRRGRASAPARTPRGPHRGGSAA